jgi:glucose-1-phosphate thymidylyltransferase
VTYIRQDVPRGIAHCVLLARDYLADDDFVMYLGDNFIIGGISQFVDAYREGSYDAQILLTSVPDPSQFGVAVLDSQGRVVELEEKPRAPKSDLALVGVYIFNSSIHDVVATLEPSGRGELEITDAIQCLITSGKEVRSQLVTGYWKDTGRVEDMLECNRAVLETLAPRVEGSVDADSELVGRVVVEEGAKIVRSRVVGPVIVGAGSTVVDSYVGPFTSLEECVVEDSEIEYSIVMADSRICGVRRLERSLIGRAVEVTPASGSRTHRLVLGDHSRVQIHR